jgi:glutathione S-transferase
MTKPFTLYGRSGSGSFAVQVALEEIGAPYERIWVSRDPAEIARFCELNPTGKVPALVLPDGTLMFESAAMLVHLALQYPAASLAPKPGNADSDAIRQKGVADFLAHLELASRGLRPYLLGPEYSVADVYLHMLASWYPNGNAELHERLPALGAHAALLSARPAMAKVEADHAAAA